MLELNIKNIVLRLDFSFFAVLSLFFFFDSGGCGICAMCAAVCHEIGHLIILCAVGARTRSITLYGAGIRIGADTELLSPSKKAAVLAAGCAVNLLLFPTALLMHSRSFAAANLALGLFNLIPIGELDGAQLYNMLCKGSAKPAATAVIRAACLISCAAALKAAGINIGLSFAATCIYMLLIMAK